MKDRSVTNERGLPNDRSSVIAIAFLPMTGRKGLRSGYRHVTSNLECTTSRST
jgi:hypothetical protein